MSLVCRQHLGSRAGTGWAFGGRLRRLRGRDSRTCFTGAVLRHSHSGCVSPQSERCSPSSRPDPLCAASSVRMTPQAKSRFRAPNPGAIADRDDPLKWRRDAIRLSSASTPCEIPTKFRHVGALSEAVSPPLPTTRLRVPTNLRIFRCFY